MTATIEQLTDPNVIRRLGGMTVLSNGFIRVVTDDVVFPNGAVGQYSTVVSGIGLGVIAVPFVNFRGIPYLGLVRQYRYPIGYYTLEFPRGSSRDLSVDEAARELVEETGLVCTSAIRLGTLRPDTGILTTEVAIWKTVHQPTDVRPDHLEHESGATVHWYSHGEVLGMIASGRITCGMTMAAFALMAATGSFSVPQ